MATCSSASATACRPTRWTGRKPAPKIAELDKNIKFDITNPLALILQASVTDEKTVADAGNTTSASPVTSCDSDTCVAEFLLLQLQPGRSGAVHCRGRFRRPASPTSATMSFIRAASNDLEQGFGV